MGLFSRKQAPDDASVAPVTNDMERLRFAVQIIMDAQSRMTITDVEGRQNKQPCCERLSILEEALIRFNVELLG